MSQQGLRQASFRAISGTSGTYNDDAMAAFDVQVPAIPPSAAFDDAFIQWLQFRLVTTEDDLPNLMQAFAEANGAYNWCSLGTFPP